MEAACAFGSKVSESIFYLFSVRGHQPFTGNLHYLNPRAVWSVVALISLLLSHHTSWKGLRMHQLPFRRPGRFYRGNLHTHSTRSDGQLAPEVVVEAYRAHGYDFVALTDHFLKQFDYPLTDTSGLRSATFTTLIGAELHAPRTEAGLNWHLVAVGLPLDFAPPSPTESGPELAARAASLGAFVGIAHPAWYSLTLADALTIEAAHAVEVYNEGSAQWSDRGNSWYLCDLMLGHGRRVNAYAADDAHFLSSRPAAFAAWVQVRAAELTPEALLAALRAGAYYSSQGPEIHNIAVERGQIAISCSPAATIIVTGASVQACQAHGESLTTAAFPLAAFTGSYCRVTVIDALGRRAWSNPIWLTDFAAE
jgi:predicted metal-dependent phosphoesterase TrpH